MSGFDPARSGLRPVCSDAMDCSDLMACTAPRPLSAAPPNSARVAAKTYTDCNMVDPLLPVPPGQNVLVDCKGAELSVVTRGVGGEQAAPLSNHGWGCRTSRHEQCRLATGCKRTTFVAASDGGAPAGARDKANADLLL